jgi:hypothetical protein
MVEAGPDMSEMRLRVFIGSAMSELRDAREVIHTALKQRGVDASSMRHP